MLHIKEREKGMQARTLSTRRGARCFLLFPALLLGAGSLSVYGGETAGEAMSIWPPYHIIEMGETVTFQVYRHEPLSPDQPHGMYRRVKIQEIPFEGKETGMFVVSGPEIAGKKIYGN